MTKSIEERVEDYYKQKLNDYGVRTYLKAEKVNSSISKALNKAFSKQGGSGANIPDIKVLLEDEYRRAIPVMIEAKGTSGKLEKTNRAGEIIGITFHEKDGKIGGDGNPIHRKGDPDYSVISNYAVNGALHYGKAILDYSKEYDEVIVIGLNGTRLDERGNVENPEHKAYYVSKENGCIPKHIKQLDKNLSLLSPTKISQLYEILDDLSLSEEELKELREKKEACEEATIKLIRQHIGNDPICGRSLGFNERLYFLIGLIIAGTKTPGMSVLLPDLLCGNDSVEDNDGKVILGRIRAFLSYKKCSKENTDILMRMFEPVFLKAPLWKAADDESVIKKFYKEVVSDAMPLFNGSIDLSASSGIYKALTAWENPNGYVSTPLCVARLMARMARVDMRSSVWDPSMGTGNLLMSAIDLMTDCIKKNADTADELDTQISAIRSNQIIGEEMRSDLFGLALLNTLLMGSCDAGLYNDGANRTSERTHLANVLLTNPPCTSPGKGLSHVYKALKRMEGGYACVIVRENAGSGSGGEYARDILRTNTLLASVRMPENIFVGEAFSQAMVLLFQVNRPHEKDDLVTFVDFSNDGYDRQVRQCKNDNVVIKDVDNAETRYEEIVARLTGKQVNTAYYTEENGLVIKDVITLKGNDWTFAQHIKMDTEASHEDFQQAVYDYVNWKLGAMLKGEGVYND